MSTTVKAEALMKMAPGFIHAQLLCTDEILGGGGFRYVQADDVRHVEQLHQVPRTRIALPRRVCSRCRSNRPFMPIISAMMPSWCRWAAADDARLLAAGFDAAVGQLLQTPRWHWRSSREMPRAAAAGSPQYPFGHERVLEKGALKTGDAAHVGGVEGDLVGADAEAADASHQLGGGIQHLLR